MITKKKTPRQKAEQRFIEMAGKRGIKVWFAKRLINTTQHESAQEFIKLLAHLQHY